MIRYDNILINEKELNDTLLSNLTIYIYIRVYVYVIYIAILISLLIQ